MHGSEIMFAKGGLGGGSEKGELQVRKKTLLKRKEKDAETCRNLHKVSKVRGGGVGRGRRGGRSSTESLKKTPRVKNQSARTSLL